MKKKTLLTAILSIVMCMSLMAGATFALFTSESTVNIAITSGKVAVEASVSDVFVKDLNEATFTRSVANGETVGFESQGTDTRTLTFANGKDLTLSNISCGDAVKFKVNVSNAESTIAAKYRVVINGSGELFDGLVVEVNGQRFLGKTFTAWKLLAAGAAGETIDFEIELPDTGNDVHDNKFQEKSCAITVVVEGVQGNAETFDETNAGVIVEAANDEVATDTTISANGFTAEIPAGTALVDGATTATLQVSEEEAQTGNFNVEGDGIDAIGLNISIPEVAEDNDKPITITLEEILPKNLANVVLYHKGVVMTKVDNADAVDADNEYYYDATTGNLTIATDSFSNFSAVMFENGASTEAELISAVDAGKNVALLSDITLTKTLMVKKDIVIDLNGKVLGTTMTGSKLLQLSSDTDPSVVLTSLVDGAKINVGDNGLALSYGPLTVSNVEINVAEIADDENTSTYEIYNKNIFNMYGDLTIGAGTVINVKYLGASLISNNGAIDIAIDGAVVNVGDFKVNGGALISINKSTTVALSNSEFNIDNLFVGQFGAPSFISEANNAAKIDNCVFNIMSGEEKYAVVKLNESETTVRFALYNNAKIVTALEGGKEIVVYNNLPMDSSKSNAYGKTAINIYGGTLDMAGHVFEATGSNGTWDSAINITGGTIKNAVIASGFRGIFINHNNDEQGKVYLENVVINGTTYTISCDQGTNNGLEATNCTFNGWTSYAATIGEVKFTDCSFGKGAGYAYCRPYAPTEFVGCDFAAGFKIDARAAITFENCTIGGVALTADNLATLMTSSSSANATVK